MLHDFIPYIASLLLGIGSSFFAWWLLQHYLTPNATFSQELAKYRVPGGGVIYLIAFENTGRRPMVDIEVIARIGVREYNGAAGWAYFSVRTNATQMPELEKERRGVVRIYDDREDLSFVDPPSKGLRDDVNECHDLEQVLNLGAETTVQVHMFCTDAFTGTRHHLKSKEYDKYSIRNGRFRGLNVVNAGTTSGRVHSRSAL